MSDREQRDPSVRRIVVNDESRQVDREVRGRRLQSPPAETPVAKAKTKSRDRKPGIRREVLFAGVGALLILIMLVAALALRRSGNGLKTKRAEVKPSPEVSAISVATPESQESVQIEDDAKQVVRRMSRDNKPYSFSEQAVKDIESRVAELSRSPSLPDSLTKLHEKSAAIGSQATKAGLQSSLVLLVGLALSKGGDNGDCIAAANRALPQLASLNKTFGSIEAESCLVLIAALPEGVGTARSHPLLKRMNKVVNNPLTERNIWYLHDQHVISEEAYDLVVNTIAYGVIAANPQRFGLSNDPLSF